MTKVINFFIFLTLSFSLSAEQYPSLSKLNKALIPVYEALTQSDNPNSLLGKNLKLTLNLRHASERHLLFNDTKIIIDEETSYYLIKWDFDPTIVRKLIDNSNITVKVEGQVIEVITGQKSPNMPYLIIKLDNVQRL